MFLKECMDCFAFSLHDLGLLKGQDMHINLTNKAPVYRKPYKCSNVERKMICVRKMIFFFFDL